MVEVLNKTLQHYMHKIPERLKMVLDMIEGASVAVGGSVTIMDMGLVMSLENRNIGFERFKQPSYEAMVEVYRQSFMADYLVTSANAITKTESLSIPIPRQPR